MDVEGIELLEPSTARSRSVRTANPFGRERPCPSQVESEDAVSSRLQVVYDCHFDRFFLREDSTAAPQKASTPHLKSRAAVERTQMKPRPSQCVQWEDLLLPLRSATKRDTLKAIASDSVLSSGPAMSADEEPTVSATPVPSLEPRVPPEKAILPGPTNDVKVHAAALAQPDISIVGTMPCELVTTNSPECENQQSAIAVTVMVESLAATSAQPMTEFAAMAPATAVIPRPKRTKFEAAVVLMRSLQRFVRRRSEPRSPKFESIANNVGVDPETPSSVAAPESGSATALSNSIPVTESASPLLSLSLRLDLTAITSPDSAASNTTSPSRKSPQKRTRIANYEQHFAKAATPGKSSQHVKIDDADEKEVRWQGDVIKVSVEVSREHQSTGLSRRPRHAGQSQLITHVYNLKDLMRIRPAGDGFRRVNDSCKFTELTSSESESESEEEIAIAKIVSSDEEDDPHYVFKRGERVLFYARHRWFKGTILRRIKASWFYDIRAANGNVFEAIQTRRIRIFDGEDEKPKVIEYEVGDRVLWRPVLGSEERSLAKQNYKAKIKAVRREERGAGKVYDLELRTGRVLKKVRGELLRHLHHRSQYSR